MSTFSALYVNTSQQGNFTFTYTGTSPIFGFDPTFLVLPIIFIFVFVVIVVILIARRMGSPGMVQRPQTGDTAFGPPPPPDTEMVKCQYCGTVQRWSASCAQCGAPMPKP